KRRTKFRDLSTGRSRRPPTHPWPALPTSLPDSLNPRPGQSEAAARQNRNQAQARSNADLVEQDRNGSDESTDTAHQHDQGGLAEPGQVRHTPDNRLDAPSKRDQRG